MPGLQFIDRDAAVVGQRDVDFRLGLGERFARQLVELVEQLKHFGLVLLGQKEPHRVKVGKPRSARGFVAQQHQLSQIFGHRGADSLARLPNGLPLGGVFGFLQYTPGLAVGDLLAVELGAIDVKCLLDFIGL